MSWWWFFPQKPWWISVGMVPPSEKLTHLTRVYRLMLPIGNSSQTSCKTAYICITNSGAPSCVDDTLWLNGTATTPATMGSIHFAELELGFLSAHSVGRCQDQTWEFWNSIPTQRTPTAIWFLSFPIIYQYIPTSFNAKAIRIPISSSQRKFGSWCTLVHS
jgi:hypothetical protein